MVVCGFNFFIDCECCDYMFGFRVSSFDNCDECAWGNTKFFFEWQ